MILGVEGVILVFLRAIVLQPDSSTECINNPTNKLLVLLNSRTIDTVVKCIVSPTVCRTNDTPVKTSVS